MRKRIVSVGTIILITIIGIADARAVRSTRDRLAIGQSVIRSGQGARGRVEPITGADVRSVASAIDKDVIIKKLEAELLMPIDNSWDDRVNDLFDLAVIDRQMARDYFKKIYTKMKAVVAKPLKTIEDKPVGLSVEVTPIIPLVEPIVQSGDEPMKKSAGRPAPPKKFGVPKVETAESVPSGDEPMKRGAPPLVPSRQLGVPSGDEPMKKGTPPPPMRKPAGVIGGPKNLPAKGVVPVVAPKVVEQVFSVPKLKELDNDRLIALLDDLLTKLPSNWNGQAVEKVEEKTKYGSRVYNVYGAPLPKWLNDINTLKKVFILKDIMPEQEIVQKIADRIAQVRSEKNVKPAVLADVEEKPKEELTEQDLVKLIKPLLAEPKTTEIGWVVSVKGNIKALDKINHATALEYHNKFIEITKEKPFLK